MNRLSRYSDGLIEISWLFAVIISSLYFYPGLDQTFVIGKTMLFRTIVMIGAAAWVAKWISNDGRFFWGKSNSVAWAKITGQPLLLLVGGLAAVYILSSAFSVSPFVSLLGTYQRFEGLITLLTYILLFALIAFNLRLREQVDRLITTLAAVSFAVDFFAILQHFGFDSIAWGTLNVSDRALSTIGQPIFLAAFLGMTLMLMLGRVVFIIETHKRTAHNRGARLVLAAFYLLVCVLNVISMWYSASRGPLIALFAGLFFFGFSILIYFRLRRVFYIFAFIAAIFLTFTAVLNIQNGPLSDLRNNSLIGPLGHIFDAETGTGRTRVLIWNGMLRLFLPHDPIQFPNTQTTDQWNIIRPLIGHGPETISNIYEDFYLPELLSLESYNLIVDHAHNEFWEVLVQYGLLGLIVEYGLFLSLIYYGLKWLGWISSRLESLSYWLSSVFGGVMGGILASTILGAEYLGLGIPLGLLLGAVIILLRRIFDQKSPSISDTDPWREIILISSLALIIFHYVELLFGIPIICTRILFWIASALLLVVGRGLSEEPARASIHDRMRHVWVGTAMSVVILLALVPGFILNQTGLNDPLAIFVNSLTFNSNGYLWMFVGIMLFTCLIFELEFIASSDQKGVALALFLSPGITLIVSVLAMLGYSGQIASIPKPPYIDSSQIFASYLSLMNIQFGTLVICMYGYTFLLLEPVSTRKSLPKPMVFIGFGSTHLLVLIVAVLINLRPLQANTAAQLFNSLKNSGQYPIAFKLEKSLLALDPLQDAYYFNVAEFYKNYASANSNRENVTGYLLMAEKYYTQAYELNPLYQSNQIGMAQINRLWALLSQNLATQKIRVDQAEKYYSFLLNGRPYRVKFWVEWAGFRAEFGDFQGAREKINAAIKIDPAYAPAYLLSAGLYSTESQNSSDPARRVELLNKALKDVAAGIEMLDRRAENPSLALLQLGDIYYSLQQYTQARDIYLRSDKFGAGDYQWELYKNLAEVSGKLNDTSAQREYLRQAIALAPSDQIAGLQAQLDSLAP